jgi:tripartite-type tricarboxylate transporter receptor subunit TctC
VSVLLFWKATYTNAVIPASAGMTGGVMQAWIAGVLLAFAALPAIAQDNYPSKPIRFIAPYPPGGSSDVLARVIAQKLTEALGGQVIVENRAGTQCEGTDCAG